MADYFDPDAIRGDIESAITEVFYPRVYSTTQSYAPGDRVRLGGAVYWANTSVSGVTPPSAEWNDEGPAYKLIYENVESNFAEQGSIRISISWTETSDASIGCPSGTLRSVEGVLSAWIFTPRNRGTSAGLKAAARLRQQYLNWSRLGTCGKGVRISTVNGPRAGGINQGDDFYVHILSARLTAMEQVRYLG